MVIGWYTDPFQRLQQFLSTRKKLPETALPSLAWRDTIYGLVLWNPHRQRLLTAEVPPEKEEWRLSLEPQLRLKLLLPAIHMQVPHNSTRPWLLPKDKKL